MVTIKAAASLAGLTVKAVRHYENMGLVKPSARTPAGYRLYSDEDIFRLSQIQYFRELKFPLQDVAKLLDAPQEEVRQALGIRRQIPLRVVPGLPSPMLVGILSPVVCLPDPSLPQDQLRMVLLHELTHYKRKDLLLKWLALLVNALHWFNPLAWLLTRSLGQACEDACDRDVTRDMTLQERKLYMSTILTLAQA